MSNRLALIIIAVFLVVSALDSVFLFENNVLSQSFGLAKIVALIMMVANGTFSDRKYFRFVYLLLGITILGTLFKILHWTGADELLSSGITALVIVYVIHFATKPEKGMLDILKLLTVVSYAGISLAVLMHRARYSWELRLIDTAIFWSTFIWFLVEGIQKKRLFTKENP